jgi:acyl carrier protein
VTNDSPSSESVERDLREFLAANYFLGDDPSQLAGESSLIEAGLIDSTGVLELVGFLEEKFDVRITTRSTTSSPSSRGSKRPARPFDDGQGHSGRSDDRP